MFSPRFKKSPLIAQKKPGLIVRSLGWVKTTTRVVFFYSDKSWYGKKLLSASDRYAIWTPSGNVFALAFVNAKILLLGLS